MKNTLRIISLLLTVFTLLSFVACAEPVGGETTTGGADAPATTVVPDATTEDLYDEEGYLKSDLPPLDYGQEVIHFLWWTDVENLEFFVEEDETTDLISDAVYARNAKVEETLNIQFEWIEQKGQYNNGVGAAYADFVGNYYATGDSELDIITAHSRTIALCSQRGYCANLLSLDYLDFQKPWWPQDMVETATIGDELYYVTGDCSTNALHMMYTLFYNKDIMKNNQIEEPAQLVVDDAWTIEALHRVTSGLYQDLDQSGGLSLEDFYGFTTLNWHLDGIYYGSDMILVEKDAEDLLVVSPDYTSEKAVNLASSMYEWISTESIYTSSSHTKPFVNGNAFMSIGRNSDFTKTVADWDFSFGIAPCPKYDENQEGYITVLGNPVSFYSIYTLSEDTNRAAAVLECWASEAYRTTTPAVFEQTMKLRYSETSLESQMYDIMREGLVFDVGRYYNSQLSAMSDNWDNACISGQNWSSISKIHLRVIEKSLKGIAEAYMAIQQD